MTYLATPPPPCFCTVYKHAVNGAIVVIHGEVFGYGFLYDNWLF